MPDDALMKKLVMLLLTNDGELEETVAQALLELGGVSHLTRDAGDALQIVVDVPDLDLAIIDFDSGCHGMTLLSAINSCHEELPIIVVTSSDVEHAAALAYANGAAACVAKPVTATEVALVLSALTQPKLQLTAA